MKIMNLLDNKKDLLVHIFFKEINIELIIFKKICLLDKLEYMQVQEDLELNILQPFILINKNHS